MKGPVSEVKGMVPKSQNSAYLIIRFNVDRNGVTLPNALAETNTGSISGVVTNPDGGLMRYRGKIVYQRLGENCIFANG